MRRRCGPWRRRGCVRPGERRAAGAKGLRRLRPEAVPSNAVAARIWPLLRGSREVQRRSGWSTDTTHLDAEREAAATPRAVVPTGLAHVQCRFPPPCPLAAAARRLGSPLPADEPTPALHASDSRLNMPVHTHAPPRRPRSHAQGPTPPARRRCRPRPLRWRGAADQTGPVDTTRKPPRCMCRGWAARRRAAGGSSPTRARSRDHRWLPPLASHIRAPLPPALGRAPGWPRPAAGRCCVPAPV
ncbi:hypothetical protein D9M72_150770 [compost metagenome]